MQQIAVVGQGSLTRPRAPLCRRFVAKLAEVLPTALASLIGGFLFTQYQPTYKPAPLPAAEQVAPASAEMLQLVRDEHAMILDYLKAQTAAERSRNAAADREDARAVAVAEAAAAASPRRVPVVAAAPVVSRSEARAIAAAPATAPALRIVAEQTDGGALAATAPRQSDSLLAKTLTIKDHVVHATLHAVSAIGGIPSWIASFGDRLSGANTNAPATSRLVSAS